MMNHAPGIRPHPSSRSTSAAAGDWSGLAWAIGLSALYTCAIFAPRLLSDLYATAGASTDAATHYYWSKDYFEALSQGIWLPSWASSTYGGLGSPVLYIYPPLFYFTTSVVAFLVRDIFLSIVVVLAAANFATGILSFQMFRRVGMPALGLVAAFVVQFAPLAQVTDTAFAAWPTYLAVPFILLFFHFSINLRPERLLHGGVALSAAVLCFAHILTALNVFLCTGIACSVCALLNMRRANMEHGAVLAETRGVIGWLISTLLGIGMASFYVLPAVTSMSLFAARSVDTSFPWYKAFLLSPVTGAHYGLYWPLVQVVLPGVTLAFLVLACWAYWRRRGPRDETEQWRRATCMLLTIGLVSMFLATELSYPLWKYVYPIRANLFPARLLQLASVAAMLAFLLTWYSRMRGTELIRRLGISAAMAIPAALTLALSIQFYVFDGKPRRAFYDAPASVAKRDQSGYYRPKHSGPGWETYIADGGLSGMCRRKGLVCTQTGDDAHRKAWEIAAKSTVKVELPLFWFPNWRVTVNGQVLDTAPAADSGVIALELPPGRHLVEANWIQGPRRMIGAAISAASCTVLIAAFALGRRRTRPRRHGLAGIL